MAVEIIEVSVNNPVIIRSTMTFFRDDQTKANGFVAYDNEKKVSFYPIFSDPTSEPVTFIHECLLQAGNDFKNMMRLAYLKHKDILIDKKTVYWNEYENMFAKQTFYVKTEEASIIDMETLQMV